MEQELVVIAVFTRFVDADMARLKLEFEGIHSIVANEIITGVWDGLAGLTGGLRLAVARADAKRAIKALRSTPAGKNLVTNEETGA